jgi:protein-disulfide isomerase
MATAGRKTNWFAIWISVGVVVVLVAVGGLVVWMNSAASGPGTMPEASNVNQETGAISFGTGEKTMDTYVDFMCPICNQFEQAYGESIQGLVEDGTITLNVHPISILDRSSQGTKFSTRAASAMYCVAANDPDAALGFMQAMYAGQPSEGSTGLTDDEISAIAAQAGATNSASCIADGTYTKYVTSMTPKTPIAPGSTSIGTPTIAINGEVISNSTLPEPANLATLFQ